MRWKSRVDKKTPVCASCPTAICDLYCTYSANPLKGPVPLAFILWITTITGAAVKAGPLLVTVRKLNSTQVT